MSTKPFYNHIAGLRGIAILLVFLFHLVSVSFPYGYYGVDIFLVISGYLLFVSFNRQGQHLDLKEFATKKLYRILPPMVILVLCTMIAGIVFQDCEDLVFTSRTGRYTLFGYVNDFLRKNQDDYFAANALDNPFLHMWYLAVTIHLYIMFALGGVVYRYIPKRLSMICLWVIGIASFCYSYSYQFHHIFQMCHLPVWEQMTPVSHYSTLPRVWELLAGGAILLLPVSSSKMKSTILTLAGLCAAVFPAVSSASLASYGAPVVVIGTMLIIRYMPSSCVNSILSNKLLIWIGGISFSLYLVHMPIIAYFRIWYQGIHGWEDYVAITTLSLIVAVIFWFCVEKRRINIFVTLGLWIFGLIVCVLGKETEGFKDYVYPEINAIRITPYDNWKFCSADVLSEQYDASQFIYNNGVDQLAYSTIRMPRHPETALMQMGVESDAPKVLLIGDSHAQASYFGLNNLFQRMNVPGVFLSTSILPFWDRFHWLNPTYHYEQSKAEALLKWLEAHPCITHVFIGQYWRARLEVDEFTHWDLTKEPMNEELYFNSLKEFIKKLKALDKHVVLIGPWPETKMEDPCRFIRIEARKGNKNIDMAPLTCTRDELVQLNKRITPMLRQLEHEGLCSVLYGFDYIPADKPYVAYRNGEFLLSDDDHLSGVGSIDLFNYLQPQIESALSKQQPAEPLAQ